jgi:hypothetical protein
MMKKFLLTILMLFIVAGITMADIYRVNNKLTKNVAAKIYTNIQEAINAAITNDTIQIEGSQVEYDYATCSKKLIFMGPGYFLFENAGVSGNQKTAKVNYISLEEGSDGTIIMGLYNFKTYIYADNITIRRCYFNASYSIYLSDNITNLVVTECFIQGNIENDTYYSFYCVFAGSYYCENVVIANNIFLNTDILFPVNSTGIFANNVFKSVNYKVNIPSGFEIKNNIFVNSSATNITLPTLPRANICNNISTSTHFGTANSNQANVIEANIFLGSATGSPDGKYQLKQGSPAIANGEGGIDIGAFGGPAPYVLSGVPAGPIITELNINTYSTSDSKIAIKIKAKSN